jgi:hypothetical protein
MRWHLSILVMLCACGEPILKNAPKPDPGAVGGVAAAAAAAATLADPQGAAKRQEQKTKGEPDTRGVEVKETVPSSVFDHIEQAPADAGSEAEAPPPPPAAPAAAPAAGARPAEAKRPPAVPPPIPPPIPPSAQP